MYVIEWKDFNYTMLNLNYTDVILCLAGKGRGNNESVERYNDAC